MWVWERGNGIRDYSCGGDVSAVKYRDSTAKDDLLYLSGLRPFAIIPDAMKNL